MGVGPTVCLETRDVEFSLGFVRVHYPQILAGCELRAYLGLHLLHVTRWLADLHAARLDGKDRDRWSGKGGSDAFRPLTIERDILGARNSLKQI